MFNLVKQAYIESVTESNSRYIKRIEFLKKSWSEANNELPPNQDLLGRFHAPCDGYVLCDTLTWGTNKTIYRKGEFLPNPLDDDQYIATKQLKKSESMRRKYASKEKLKVDYDLAKQIVEELNHNMYVEFSHGNHWIVNGKSICYLYMTAVVENAFKLFYDKIKNVIENADKHIFKGEAYNGRKRVTGKIASTKMVHQYLNQYPYEIWVEKAYIVLDNDSSCFGTLPITKEGIFPKVGDTIEFTATFEQAIDSNSHSFYKRPHNPIIIEN